MYIINKKGKICFFDSNQHEWVVRRNTRIPRRMRMHAYPPLGVKAGKQNDWVGDALAFVEGIPEMMNALDIPTRKDLTTNRLAFWADFPLFIRDKYNVYGYRSSFGGWCRMAGMSPNNLQANVVLLGTSNPLLDTAFVLRTMDFYADKEALK